ncbi:uncharacterized protein LOC105839115 isoform X3 [Monomorium pharaonis]|uniref:uncharacterized protein LOC105839115 isoform X3 n=1 Tax=Monomorium pharaonis TaxID=307658 RepID=UPI001747A7F9|nr:uncharacterized protein LOC105839115 isoform X3 [Monomorium pharaonis]
MNFVEIHLYDADSQEVFTLKVNPKDAVKAENGNAPALPKILPSNIIEKPDTHINFVASPDKEFAVDTAACLASTSNASGEDPLDISNVDEEFAESFRWSREAILLLLEEYRQREQNMSSGKISHKKAWEQIAQTLQSKGYMVTARQCNTRVNTMKRTYKTIKDHNKKSGNDKRSWQYYDVMENFLGEKPYMVPLSTISSTGEVTEKPANIDSAFIKSSIATVSGKSACKRKHAENEEREKERERRHREKMEIKEKLLEKLDKIIEKL